jgi:hypothetical protein
VPTSPGQSRGVAATSAASDSWVGVGASQPPPSRTGRQTGQRSEDAAAPINKAAVRVPCTAQHPSTTSSPRDPAPPAPASSGIYRRPPRPVPASPTTAPSRPGIGGAGTHRPDPSVTLIARRYARQDRAVRCDATLLFVLRLGPASRQDVGRGALACLPAGSVPVAGLIFHS